MCWREGDGAQGVITKYLKYIYSLPLGQQATWKAKIAQMNQLRNN